jgi:hypothetical protein
MRLSVAEPPMPPHPIAAIFSLRPFTSPVKADFGAMSCPAAQAANPNAPAPNTNPRLVTIALLVFIVAFLFVSW